MKQYFLLPLSFLFIIGCSFQVGNEYGERRLPVDNKSYLIKQKREKKLASQETAIEGVYKRRYKFKDSERPQRREIGYRGEYMHSHPVIDEEECEQHCDANGCQSSCHETELAYDDAPEYYPDYDVRGEGIDDDYGMHNQYGKGREPVVAHTPKGVYHEKHQAKAVKIKPLQNVYKKNSNKTNVVPTHNSGKANNLPQSIQKKTSPIRTPVVDSRKVYSPHLGSEDDEGIPTIPPKVSTRDNMQNVVPQNQRPMVKGPNTVLNNTNGVQSPVSTVKETNQNIANIQSQIESRNSQNKATLQSSSLNNHGNSGEPVTEDMNNKLSQLEALTSQEKTVQPFTPKFPANNQPKMEKFGTVQQKTSSQEVHLQLDSSSGNSKPPVGEPSRSDLPPPVDLS
ncbi:MAG: hypothetical protein KBC27_01365 [Rickettsiales bacterium]|nr:hypothetical protein [Rickettsiales bacterium]